MKCSYLDYSTDALPSPNPHTHTHTEVSQQREQWKWLIVIGRWKIILSLLNDSKLLSRSKRETETSSGQESYRANGERGISVNKVVNPRDKTFCFWLFYGGYEQSCRITKFCLNSAEANPFSCLLSIVSNESGHMGKKVFRRENSILTLKHAYKRNTKRKLIENNLKTSNYMKWLWSDFPSCLTES